MRSAEIIEPHRAPTHPAVIATRFGKRQGLVHLTLVTKPTRPIVTLDSTRIDLLLLQQIESVLQFGFAMHD